MSGAAQIAAAAAAGVGRIEAEVGDEPAEIASAGLRTLQILAE
jgi:hypothetical protein